MYKIASFLTNTIYGGVLISTPLWFPLGYFVTIGLYDVNPQAKLPYLGSIVSLSTTPFALLFALGYHKQYGLNKKVSFIPIIPIAGYFLSLSAYDNQRNRSTKTISAKSNQPI